MPANGIGRIRRTLLTRSRDSTCQSHAEFRAMQPEPISLELVAVFWSAFDLKGLCVGTRYTCLFKSHNYYRRAGLSTAVVSMIASCTTWHSRVRVANVEFVKTSRVLLLLVLIHPLSLFPSPPPSSPAWHGRGFPMHAGRGGRSGTRVLVCSAALAALARLDAQSTSPRLCLGFFG